MNRRLWIGTGIVAALALAAATALAFARGGFGERGGCPFGGRGFHGAGHFGELRELKAELNLTDEQMKALRDIARRTHEQNEGTHTALKATFTEAAQVLLSDPSNVAGARAVLQRNEAAVEQLKSNILGSVAEGLKVLTPEQRQKLSAWLASHQHS